MNKDKYSLIGLDLGGTKVAAGKVTGGTLSKQITEKLDQSSEDPMDAVGIIIKLIRQLMDDRVAGIGIGVPGLVDRESGTVYDVLNIRNWKKVPLKTILEKTFGIPVYVDNDSNCFAMGEYRYGAYAGHNDFVGITLGTGMGSGIIKSGQLIPDAHCCSGEFGTISYLDGIYEDYTGGPFFQRQYGKSGEELSKAARKGDQAAQEAFNNYGRHLGNAIKTIIMAVDPPLIIIGGSVAAAHELYEEAMWRSISEIPFPSVLQSFHVKFTNTKNIAILGAAALCPDTTK
ncbi:MAG: ROK family protein [Bacteroidales bacterium]|nr:ROK family protein [Bacteroidales bacterium]